jgi:hypothetical protein
MDICNRIDERKARGSAVSRFGSINLIAPIVFRIAIFLIVLPGVCMAEEDSVLPLPLGTYRLEMIMATVSRLPPGSSSQLRNLSHFEIRKAERDSSKAWVRAFRV